MLARTKGGRPKKKAKTSASSEPTAEEKVREHQKQLKVVEQQGAQPETGAGIFIMQGANAYLLRQANLMSLANSETDEAAEVARSAAGRRRLAVNAGTPTTKNPTAGSCFHDHGQFKPTDCELHEKMWYEPRPLQFKLAPHAYCSEADVLARFAGHKALIDASPVLFLNLFLNEGNPKIETRPDYDDEDADWTAYNAQRAVIERNLRKLFLVFPEEVRPRLDGETAWPVPRNDILLLGDPPSEDEDDRTGACSLPCTVACFAGILSDKREGSPGAAHKQSIGGYHEKCRMYELKPDVLRKVVRIMEHFDLDIKELVYASLHERVDFATYREAAITRLGPAPLQLGPDLKLDAEWCKKRAAIPFAKPWVQRCNFEYPNGEVDGHGAPVLVPLSKGCAEERNGTCWLDPDAVAEDHPMAQPLQVVLCRLAGRIYKPPKMPKAAETAIRELEASLKSARKEVESLRNKLQDQEQELASVGNKYVELKETHDAGLLDLCVEAPEDEDVHDKLRRGEVRLGGVDARVLIKRKQPGTLILCKPNGEACWRGNISTTDKLVLRFTPVLADDSD